MAARAQGAAARHLHAGAPDQPRAHSVTLRLWHRLTRTLSDEQRQKLVALANSDDAALEAFRAGLKRRDVFVPAGVRYADPRQGLLSGEAWNAARLTVCCSLDRSPDAGAEMSDLTARLDLAWRQVAANLPDNPAARIERRNGRDKLVLSPLDKPERPPSLIALQSAVAARMPKIDLPDVMLEVAARSGFAKTFTHVSERHARVEDFTTSLCGGLIAQACNIGFRP